MNDYKKFFYITTGIIFMFITFNFSSCKKEINYPYVAYNATNMTHVVDSSYRATYFVPEPYDYVYILLVKHGVKYPEIVLSQAILESGWFSSHSFKHANNPFGMKKPEIRETTATGIYMGHARYNSLSDAVADYKIWQNWFIEYHEIKDEQTYLLTLTHYATDKHYVNKVAYINNKIE